MTVHFLRPQKMAGFTVEYHQGPPEVGGIEVIIWRNVRRDDGFMFRCRDWGHVHRTLSNIKAAMAGGVQ